MLLFLHGVCYTKRKGGTAMYPYLEKNPKSIYISHNTKTYDFPAHFHNYLEIAFCFSGRQNVKVGETVYTLSGGDAVLIFPNTAHEYIAHPAGDSPTEVLALICNTKLLAESMPDIVTKSAPLPFIEKNRVPQNARLAFGNILSAKTEPELLGWTYILLAALLEVTELAPCAGNLELPARVVAYIDANFKEDLTIEHLAGVFGYHPSYIAHLFCDQLKMPFRTYLGAVRSEYAAAKIRTTDKSLTEIAYDAGFNSLNTFCRCFKKHFGTTPSEYKKTRKST